MAASRLHNHSDARSGGHRIQWCNAPIGRPCLGHGATILSLSCLKKRLHSFRTRNDPVGGGSSKIRCVRVTAPMNIGSLIPSPLECTSTMKSNRVSVLAGSAETPLSLQNSSNLVQKCVARPAVILSNARKTAAPDLT